jgi:adenylate kinase
MKLIILGPPGSGKGTYASRVGPKFEIPQISTGQILREARDDPEFGEIIKEAQDKGNLVSTDVVIKMLKKRLTQSDCEKGFILDGFPRSVEQAELIADIAIDYVINLNVPDEIIIKRLSSRRQCGGCGEIYNILYLKPKADGVCDKCGGELVQRDDDKEAVIKDRLELYKKVTYPLIDYYKDKVRILDITCTDINVPPEVMVGKIMMAIEDAQKK